MRAPRVSAALAVAFVVTLLAAGGCKGGSGNADVKRSGIGEFASLTGGTATFGQATHEGLLLALEEAAATSGLPADRLKLVSEDDQSKPDVARTVVTKLVTQDNVAAVIGEVASTRSMAAAPVCQQYKVPMISPASTNPEVTRKGDFIFRVCFTDDFQAGVMAQFAWDQGYRQVAIFKDIKNDYSVGFAQNFTDRYVKLGGKIVGEQSFQEGDTDFRAQLNSLKGLAPAAILVPGYYSEVGTIARQAREVGIDVPLLGGDGWDSPQLVPGAGEALEGCFFSNHYFSVDLEEPHVQKFVAAYRKRFDRDPDALAALGYDAGGLLVDAIKRAKTYDAVSIRDAIAETKDYSGVTGTITMDENRNARKPAVILQVQGKKFKVFKVYDPEALEK